MQKRCIALALPVAMLFACGGGNEASSPRVGSDADGLTRCFSNAYDEADKDAAFARCEQKNFGTAWREKAHPRDGAPLGSGHLDPQIVQSGIGARMPRMRACYAAGLRRDANLRGEMKIKFTIDTTGHTLNVEDAGSHMRDKEVLKCVMSEFSALRFPAPEGGIVNVLYPLVISPGDTNGGTY
jgi:hypothetical protein